MRRVPSKIFSPHDSFPGFANEDLCHTQYFCDQPTSDFKQSEVGRSQIIDLFLIAHRSTLVLESTTFVVHVVGIQS